MVVCRGAVPCQLMLARLSEGAEGTGVSLKGTGISSHHITRHDSTIMCLACAGTPPVPAYQREVAVHSVDMTSALLCFAAIFPGPSARGDWPPALKSPCTCCHGRPPPSGAHLLMPAPDFNVEASCPSALPSSDSSGSAPSIRSTLSPGWAMSWAPTHQPQDHQLSQQHT